MRPQWDGLGKTILIHRVRIFDDELARRSFSQANAYPHSNALT
jgi:hypothetical protein